MMSPLKGRLTSDGTEAADGIRSVDDRNCTVCSDAAVRLRVVALAGDDAVCEDATGARTNIACELVPAVDIGQVLVCHGGVAIGRTMGKDGHEIRQ